MSDELLPYYEKELGFIRAAGADFASKHPKIAGRLRMNGETIEDPHVSRLVESFAYLNARIQHRLDDDFPELTDALFSVLYPHYLRPIPAMSIVQFKPSWDLDCRYDIEGETLLESQAFQGESCKFTTRYPLTLYPLSVEAANLLSRPFIAPGSNYISGANGVLKLQLKAFNESIKLKDLKLNKLRFYLNGQDQNVYPLQELLLNQCMKVVLAKNEDDPNPIFLDNTCVNAVGFDTEEGLLPYPAASFQGYRLLTEYFLFPEKFLFIDINGLDQNITPEYDDELNIYFYLSQTHTELERTMDEKLFSLNCSPIINLFEQQTEPLRLNHTQTSYHVIPDARRRRSLELYSIDHVGSSNSRGDSKEYLPFYGLKHKHQDNETQRFWYSQRLDASLCDGPDREGTEVFISFTDLNFQGTQLDDEVVNIRSHCSNRNLPSKLPFGGGEPRLFPINSSPPISGIDSVTPPKTTIRPPLGNRGRWRLLSHLNLNYLSLSNSATAEDALKEILALYNFSDSPHIKKTIDSIHQVNTKPCTAPISIQGQTTLCRGTQIEVVLDASKLTGSSPFLFGSVLERFFALYCSINSFTRTSISIKDKEGFIKQWPPRAGEKQLL